MRGGVRVGDVRRLELVLPVDVEVLGAEGPHGTARPCTLVLTHDTVALRDGEGGVILEDRYRRAFQVILSETFPDHLVLKLSDEASVPLRAAAEPGPRAGSTHLRAVRTL